MGASHRLHTRPVFVDGSGRRRRGVVVAGAAVATALVIGLVVLAFGFLGTPAGHVPGLPGVDGLSGSNAPRRSDSPAADRSDTRSPTPSPQPTVAKLTPPPGATPSQRVHPTHPPRPTKTR
jgi:hypothetical protein